MPRIEEFLAELRVAGVTITGEGEICRRVRREVTWPALLADLASAGRKDGITFTRSGADGPTDTQLQNILRGVRVLGGRISTLRAERGADVKRTRPTSCWTACSGSRCPHGLGVRQ